MMTLKNQGDIPKHHQGYTKVTVTIVGIAISPVVIAARAENGVIVANLLRISYIKGRSMLEI
jgi:hypothetical protein